MTTGCRSTNFV